jgi:hypothetical protein
MKMITDYLQKEEYTVFEISFPNYDNITQTNVNISLKQIITCNANNRYVTFKNKINEHYYDGNTIVFINGYTTYDMIELCYDIEDIEERLKMVNYIYDFEHIQLKTPEPDLVMFINTKLPCDMKISKKLYHTIHLAGKYKWKIIETNLNGYDFAIEDVFNELIKEITK